MLFKSKPSPLSSKAIWDYLTSEQDAPLEQEFVATALGEGAALYGITEGIGRSLHMDLDAGITPEGHRNIQSNNGKHVGGIGTVYAADKWFSALLATVSEQERQELREMYSEIVKEHFSRLEVTAKVGKWTTAAPSKCERGKRKQGSKQERVTAKLIGMHIQHNTARPTEETETAERPPDVHVHDHVYIYNMAWIPDPHHSDKGRWGAIDDDDLSRLEQQFTHELTSELARRCEERGYKIDYVQNKHGKWRTKIPALDELCSFWSSNDRRKEQLREEFMQKNMRPPTEKELSQQMSWTRLYKNLKAEREMDWVGLVEGARRAGQKIVHVTRGRSIDQGSAEQRKRSLLKRLLEPNGLCASDAVFNRREMNTKIAEAAVGLGMTWAEQDEFRIEVMEHLEPVKINESDLKCSWTTKKNLKDEFFIERCLEGKLKKTNEVDPRQLEADIKVTARRLGLSLTSQDKEAITTALATGTSLGLSDVQLELVKTLQPSYNPEPVANTFDLPTAHILDQMIKKEIASLFKEEGILLDHEQEGFVRDFFAKGCPVYFLNGYAGTGKTASVKCIVRVLRNTDYTKFPIADQVVTVSMARDTALRSGDKLKTEHKDSVESFCMGVMSRRIRPTERTFVIVDEAYTLDNPRLVKFLKSLGKGNVLFLGDVKQLQSIGAGGAIIDAARKFPSWMLTKVRRQIHEEDIEALFNLRSGKSKAALESWDSMGRVSISATNAERMGEVIAKAIQLRDEGRSATDIAIVIDGANADVDTMNHIMQFDRLKRGELKGEPLTLKSEATLRKWDIYEGDEVSFVRGYFWEHPTDYKQNIKVPNGRKAKVLKIDHEKMAASLVVDGFPKPVEIQLNENDLEQPFSPRYAFHAMRLQGGEVPVILSMPGCGTTNREAGYSQMSRLIEEAYLFLDHETHGGDKGGTNPFWMLQQRWKQSKPKVSARTQMKRERAMELARMDKEAKERLEEEQRHARCRRALNRGIGH